MGNSGVATSDGYANLVTRSGLGANNGLSAGSYTFNLLTRNRIKLETMYRGSWIVGSAVDSIAEDMTRAGISISGSIEPDKIGKVNTQLTRLGIWRSFLDAIRWGRLYGGAIATIVIDGQDESTPLDISTVSSGQFKGLLVYDRWSLQPSLERIVTYGINAGLPEYYSVVSDVNSGTLSGVKWHHSRVIRFIGIQLPVWQAITEQMWGESILERMNDRLVAFDEATMGVANLINKAHLRTIGIPALREILASGGDREQGLLKMFEYMRIFQNNEGITLLDSEDQFQAHNYTFSGLNDVVLQFGQQIAGATGIPLVRLFGQSPAGLNSTGENDMRMYYDNILAQQESRLRDGVHLILSVLYRSLFAGDAPKDLDFEFVPLWQTSQKEKADIMAVVTNSITQAYDAGIIDHVIALKELKQSSESTGIYSNITEEDVKKAEMTPAPMMVETQQGNEQI